jgi:hypothetical protein
VEVGGTRDGWRELGRSIGSVRRNLEQGGECGFETKNAQIARRYRLSFIVVEDVAQLAESGRRYYCLQRVGD